MHRRARQVVDGGGEPSTEGQESLPETLDPGDWEEFRSFLHKMCDEMVDVMRAYGSSPVWKPAPPEIKAKFDELLPVHGQGMRPAYDEFLKHVLPYGAGNVHPRFWGWVLGGGSPVGAVGDFLAAVMNTSVSNFDQVPALVELQVIRTLIELLEFPGEASGIFVSGCSEANLLGLIIARNAKAPFDVRREGMGGRPTQLCLYASNQAHSSIRRAAEIIGVGGDGLRLTQVNRDYAIDIEHLRALVKEDRAAGRVPFCVVGTAGTVNTGALDNLVELAGFARQESLWFHVDGALGAAARFSSNLRSLVAGLEDADSVSLDFHKVLGQPFDVGCLICRSSAIHRDSFAFEAEYFSRIAGSISDGVVNFSELGIQTTRSFRALKVWLSLKVEGRASFGLQVEKSVALARYFAQRVARDKRLEQMAPAVLNIVVFRYIDSRLSDDQLARVNLRILIELQREGIAVISSTTLNKVVCLRVAIVNHRTSVADIDLVLEEVVRRGEWLTAHELG